MRLVSVHPYEIDSNTVQVDLNARKYLELHLCRSALHAMVSNGNTSPLTQPMVVAINPAGIHLMSEILPDESLDNERALCSPCIPFTVEGLASFPFASMYKFAQVCGC